MQDEIYHNLRPHRIGLFPWSVQATSSLIPSAAPDELGLIITDAGATAIVHVHPVAVENTCPRCYLPDRKRDCFTIKLFDLPVVGFPAGLLIRVPHYLCNNSMCARVIFQASTPWAKYGGKLTYRVSRWILQRLAIDRMIVHTTAKALGIGWGLVNQIAIEACRDLVCNDPGHCEGARVQGVDEHVWKHTKHPGQRLSFVTVLAASSTVSPRHG